MHLGIMRDMVLLMMTQMDIVLLMMTQMDIVLLMMTLVHMFYS
jgi:hypothetical protein